MRLVTGKRSDVGRVREGNEDAYLVDEAIGLVAVADGMGGHQAGEVASATALAALRTAVTGGQGIRDAIAAANSAVIAQSTGDERLRGMGTTLTAGTVVGADTLLLGHVGDSRAYLIRDGELRQVTEDHSLVEELVRDGQLTPEQAQVHPQRSVITRALGIDPSVEIDTYPVKLRTGDRVMLCSDGLTTMVRFDNIAAILRGQPNPQLAADELIDAANLAGGEDNITVLVIDVEDGGDDDTATLVAVPAVGATAAVAAAVVPDTDADAAESDDTAERDDAAEDEEPEPESAEDPEPESESTATTGSSTESSSATDADADEPADERDAAAAAAAVAVAESDDVDVAADADDLAFLDDPDADVEADETTAEEPEPVVPRVSRRERRREARRAAEEEAARQPVVDATPRKTGKLRTTFRIIGWVLPVIVIIAIGVGVAGWYARGSYFVAADSPTLVIYKGIPGGLLGWDPTVEQTTEVDVEELSEAEIDDIGEGKKFSSLDNALEYVARLDERSRARQDATEAGPTTTTTTATTTAPPPP